MSQSKIWATRIVTQSDTNTKSQRKFTMTMPANFQGSLWLTLVVSCNSLRYYFGSLRAAVHDFVLATFGPLSGSGGKQIQPYIHAHKGSQSIADHGCANRRACFDRGVVLPLWEAQECCCRLDSRAHFRGRGVEEHGDCISFAVQLGPQVMHGQMLRVRSWAASGQGHLGLRSRYVAQVGRP